MSDHICIMILAVFSFYGVFTPFEDLEQGKNEST